MADELVMPRLSDTMERGTIARWVKQEGEAFHSGDVLADLGISLDRLTDGMMEPATATSGTASMVNLNHWS